MTELNKDPLYEQVVAILRQYRAVCGQNRILDFASVIGVTAKTMANWLAGRQNPFGESTVRLIYMLEELGYENPVRDVATDAVLQIGKLLAFRVVTLDEVIDGIGIEDHKDPRTNILSLLLGKRSCTPERDEKLANIAKEYSVLLPEEVAAFREQFAVTQEEASTVKTMLVVEERSPETRQSSAGASEATHMTMKESTGADGIKRDSMIEALALQIRALLPLAKIAASDAFSPEDRIRIRELAGGDGVFKASNLLTRLCSEKARTLV